jgi:hypothetical protein
MPPTGTAKAFVIVNGSSTCSRADDAGPAKPAEDGVPLHADDFQTDLRSHLGSAFSLEPILTQSAWFRVHNRDDAIPNLYFVGAGTHPGAGIPA